MNRCPITYELIEQDETFSKRGLHLLSPRLNQLKSIPLSAAEQRQEALARVGKMSVQGVQLKLSARLNIKAGHFEFVDQYGYYILKPPSEYYLDLPQNEALTMTMAAMIGIDVPMHGLVYAKDGSMTYFIKRFDRLKRHKKFAVEDFSQLSGQTRDTKYKSSMEKVAQVIEDFCSFPRIEAVKLFKLTLFNFLMGNEDMHLKNFSLITQNDKIMLSPAYDLLNTTIAQPNTKEEIALALNAKKNNLTRRDLVDYFGKERLKLNQNMIDGVLQQMIEALLPWKSLIQNSFLSESMKQNYLNLLQERCERIKLI